MINPGSNPSSYGDQLRAIDDSEVATTDAELENTRAWQRVYNFVDATAHDEFSIELINSGIETNYDLAKLNASVAQNREELHAKVNELVLSTSRVLLARHFLNLNQERLFTGDGADLDSDGA